MLSHESQASLTRGRQGAPCPAVTPRGAGHGPCRDTPATGWHRAGQPARGGAARELCYACQRQRGTGRRCPGRPRARQPSVGEARQPLSRPGGAELGGAGPGYGRPGSAATAPAPPAGILTQQPAGRAGTSSPRGARPQQRCRRPPAPLRRGRSSPRLPAAAPSRPQVRSPRALPPAPRCYWRRGTNFPRRAPPGAAAAPQSCPAPGAAGAAAASDSLRPSLTPRARRRRRPPCPTAQPSSSSLPVPRQ